MPALVAELSTVTVVAVEDPWPVLLFALVALENEVEVVGPPFSVVVTTIEVVLRELFTNPRPTEAPMTPEAMIAARITESSTLLVELMIYGEQGDGTITHTFERLDSGCSKY